MESVFWEAVRERAHALWLQDGCLDGKSEQHWQQAQYDVLETVSAAPVAADQPEGVAPAEILVCAEKDVEAELATDIDIWMDPAPADPAPPVPSPPVKGTSLFKLRARQCRFVVSVTCSPAIFCGAPTDGGSWCQEHRARVFVRAPARLLPKAEPKKAAAR